MVPNIEYDSILLLGYGNLSKENNLNRFNHQKRATHLWKQTLAELRCGQVDHAVGLGPARETDLIGVICLQAL